MLLPWNEVTQLLVEPQQVTAWTARSSRPVHEIFMPVAKPENAAGPYDGIGNAIRDTLLQLASRASRPFLHGPRRLNLEVADTLVHYDVLHVDARRMASTELEHLAAVGMADTLGLDPGSLAMRCSVQPDGLSAVVCGMPSALADTLRQAVDDAGYRLNRLEPGFAAFWNGHYARSKSRNALLVCLRGSALMLAWLRDGNWQALVAERLSEKSWAGLYDSCEGFCHRLCIPDHGSLPVFFDADIGEIPAGASSRWQRLSRDATVASGVADGVESDDKSAAVSGMAPVSVSVAASTLAPDHV